MGAAGRVMDVVIIIALGVCVILQNSLNCVENCCLLSPPYLIVQITSK